MFNAIKERRLRNEREMIAKHNAANLKAKRSSEEEESLAAFKNDRESRVLYGIINIQKENGH